MNNTFHGEITVNGKFRKQKITGVQRFAVEVMKFFPSVKEIIPEPMWLSSTITSIFWEQVILPFKAKNKHLLNLCNTSPLFHTHKVVTLFDVSFLDEPCNFSFFFSVYYRYVIKYASKKALRIATSSEYSKKRIADLIGYPKDSIDVVYCGVNHKFFFPREIEDVVFFDKMKIPEKYFLFVGSLDPRKNIITAIKAINYIAESHPQLKLIVCGASSKNFSAIEVGELKNVIFLGYVDDELLPHLYSNAIAFVFPSLYEGFGLPVLEAMACGTPVISSNRTSLPEVIGDAGITFEPEDYIALSEHMLNIYMDSNLRSDLIEKGICQASKFTWDRTAKLLNDCIRNAYESKN